MYAGPWKVDTAENGCGLSQGHRLDLRAAGIEVNQSGNYWGTGYQDNGSSGEVTYNSTNCTIVEDTSTSPRTLTCTPGSGDGSIWTAVDG
jgi:hypothetical protein